jgi:Na+-transporting NADH:ubiquinone oxidoreductase subunit NqrF
MFGKKNLDDDKREYVTKGAKFLRILMKGGIFFRCSCSCSCSCASRSEFPNCGGKYLSAGQEKGFFYRHGREIKQKVSIFTLNNGYDCT